MHRDGFGCLHTEDISGREIEGLPFLQKTPAVAHMPARCERKFGGNPPQRGRGVPKVRIFFELCKYFVFYESSGLIFVMSERY